MKIIKDLYDRHNAVAKIRTKKTFVGGKESQWINIFSKRS